MGRTTFAIVQNWHAALQKGLCEQALIFTIIEPKLLEFWTVNKIDPALGVSQ